MFEITLWVKDFFLYEGYIDKTPWVKVFDEMAVHTRKADPRDILSKRRPNEEQHIMDYRLSCFEHITYGSMNKAFDSLYRLMNGINYSLKIDEKLRQYIMERKFKAYTLEGFLSNVVLKRCIEDPNGFLVWAPTGEGLMDSSKKVQPRPVLVYSSQFYYADEEVFCFLSDEKSKINVGGHVEMTGKVYWIFTKTGFYKYTQVAKGNASEDYELTLVYMHNIGDLPVIVLGGDMNADCYYESFFAPYCAFGNEALRQFSDWQAALTQTVHPAVEEFATECELRIERKDPKGRTVGKEKYEHKIELRPLDKSPFNTTYRQTPDSPGQTGVLDVNVPYKRFIAPPIENAKYSGESWEKLLEKAEDALHLNLGQLNQSGAAKEIDQEAHYSMITKIGNNYFDNIMLNSLKLISAYLFPTEDVDAIVINKPSTFKVKTEADLIDEVGTLTEKKVPVIFINSATIDLAKKYFSGDELKQRIFEIIASEDPLYAYNAAEMDSMLASGVITKEAYVRKVYMYGLLLQIADDMGHEAFIGATKEAIIQKFDELIIDYIPEEPTPLFDNGAGTGAYEEEQNGPQD